MLKRGVLACVLVSAMGNVAYAVEETVDLGEVQVVGKGSRYVYGKGGSAASTKFRSSKNDLSQTINSIGQKQIQEQLPNNIADTLNYTSGVVGNYRGENNRLEVAVRGISYKQGAGGTNNVYVNGMSDSAMLEYNPFFVDNVEVVKGPAAVQYGQSNPGGLVNINLKKATGQNAQQVQVQADSYGGVGVNLDIDRALNEDFDYRLVSSLYRNKFQDHSVQQGIGLAPSFVWRVNDKLTWSVDALYHNQPKSGASIFMPYDGVAAPVDGQYLDRRKFIGDPDFYDAHNKQWFIGSELAYQINDDISLHQKSRFKKSSDFLKSVVFNTYQKPDYLFRPTENLTTTSEWGVDQYIEIDKAWDNSEYKGAFGVDYRQTQGGSSTHNFTLADGPIKKPFDQFYDIHVKPIDRTLARSVESHVKQWGLYGQNQWRLGNWVNYAGLRLDKFSMWQDDLKVSKRLYSDKDKAFTWNVGSMYQFANGVSPYISYSTSYTPNVGKYDKEGQNIKPTHAAQWEIGSKINLLDNHQLNLAYFDIDQRDFAQGNGKGDNGEAIYENAGKVKNKGFEVEMQGKILPNWSYLANYTYLDQRLVKDQKPENEGRRMWGVPHHQASLWTHYDIEQGALNGLQLGLGYRYFGSTTMNYNTPQYNDVKIPSYGLWDASIGYDLQRFDSRLKGAKLQLNVQNISNKRYTSSCANTGACWFGKARKILLNVDYQW